MIIDNELSIFSLFTQKQLNGILSVSFLSLLFGKEIVDDNDAGLASLSSNFFYADTLRYTRPLLKVNRDIGTIVVCRPTRITALFLRTFITETGKTDNTNMAFLLSFPADVSKKGNDCAVSGFFLSGYGSVNFDLFSFVRWRWN